MGRGSLTLQATLSNENLFLSFCLHRKGNRVQLDCMFLSCHIWSVWPNRWVFVYELSGSGFESSCRVQLIFLKCYHEKLSFSNVILDEKMKTHSPTNLPIVFYRTIYFSRLLQTNLLSETIYSQIQTAFICLNSAIITVE